MFCYKCGDKNDDGAAFCFNCGALLNDASVKKNKALKVILIAICSFIGFLFLFFIGLMILGAFMFLNDTKYDDSDGYANLTFDDVELSFKVPDGFKGISDNYDDYQEYDNLFGDYIIYSIDYAEKDYCENKLKYQQKFYEVNYPGSVFEKYTAVIDGSSVKVFYVDYKSVGEVFRETYVFYPIDNDYYAMIVIGIEGVSKDNLTDYVKIENKSFDL